MLKAEGEYAVMLTGCVITVDGNLNVSVGKGEKKT
jgi:hypothetical protein